jgi:hypothetical protein
MRGAIAGALAWLAIVILDKLTRALLRARAAAFRLSIAVGSLAGALLPLAALGDWRGVAPDPLVFFVLWQGAYGASLASLGSEPTA